MAKKQFRNTFLLAILFLVLQCLQINSKEEEEEVEVDTEPSGYLRKEYSLTRPFSAMQYWEILGSTMVTDDYVRLTPDQQSKRGSTWNILPCFIRDWEIHIHFNIHGHNSRLYGDGFAFWYTKGRAEAGTVFGNKDYFTGLALFFDTYANQNGDHEHDHPYISAQVSNGSIHYDHDRDGTHSELAGCSAALRGVETETHVAIRYIGSKKRLTVQYDVDDEDTWRECFDKNGVELPTGYYFGLSAQTGDLSDNHDILSMKLYELDSSAAQDEKDDYSKIVPNAENSEAAREHVDDVSNPPTRRSKAINWLLVVVLICVLGGVLAFYFYQQKHREDLKRFY